MTDLNNVKSVSTKIIGISSYYHDSAAALIIDGSVVAAAQEERFTRKKHDSSFPVVHWDSGRPLSYTDATDNFIQQNLSKEKFEYYLVSDILDGYKSNKLRYTLHQVDQHPNREANKRLAIYLATKIKQAR